MRSLILAIALGNLMVASSGHAAPTAQWITGDVFTKDGLLLFRADRPVKGNTTGNVVLLGSRTDAGNFVAPCLMRAAELHMRLRLYGEIQPVSEPPPGHHRNLPSVWFIVWKLHSPSDPDKLPPGEAIHPDLSRPSLGYKISKPK